MDTGRGEQDIDLRAAAELLASLEQLPIERWPASLDSTASELQCWIERLGLQWLAWEIADDVAAIAWCAARPDRRCSRDVATACRAATQTVLSVALAPCLAPRERGRLYGFFMRTDGRT